MTNDEVAHAFTDLLKKGDHAGAAKQFNDPEIVSLEAAGSPMERVVGTAAVEAKSKWWYDNHTVHDTSADGPFINGDKFMVLFDMDITPKATGIREEMSEIGLYTIKDGKIVEEQFFYDQSTGDDDEDEEEDEEEEEEEEERQG
ncbi:MAG: SnoaL-like domain-containing protein [Beijerinckiaceae bacterium]